MMVNNFSRHIHEVDKTYKIYHKKSYFFQVFHLVCHFCCFASNCITFASTKLLTSASGELVKTVAQVTNVVQII